MQPGSPAISPDGRFWWDGRGWQPLFTPDGMSRWNGQQWIPLAEPYGREAIAVAAAAAAPVESVAPVQPPVLEQHPAWLPEPPAASPPPPLSFVPEPEPVPAWVTPARTQSRLLVYVSVGLLAAVIAFGGWMGVRGMLLANQNTGSLASPTPFGSDYDRADRFLTGQLVPAIVEVNKTFPAVQTNCTAQLPLSCRDAIAVTDQKMRDAGKVIDQGDIPPCIADAMAKFTKDWTAAQNGLDAALGGYQSTSNELIARGLISFVQNYQLLKPDADAVDKAKLTCKR